MPEVWTAPFVAVTNDIIASSDANAGYRGNLLWIRQFFSGNPAGAGYVVESSSTDAASWVQVTAAKIASWLGYTPVNKAGDTITGSVTISGAASDLSVGRNVAATGGVSGASGSFSGAVAALSASITNALGAGSYTGGSTGAGSPSFLGINVGASGAAIAGPVSPGSYLGGSTSAGVPSFRGIGVGVDGIAVTGPVIGSAGLTGTALTIGGVTNAHVPSGLVGMFRTAAAIATGWARETNLDGRIPVGAGTTFSTTFVEDTNYGSSWSHTHTDSGHGHSLAAAGVSGNTGGPSSTNTTGGTGNTSADGGHTHPQGSLDVTGNSDNGTASISSDAWAIPSRAYVFARKS